MPVTTTLAIVGLLLWVAYEVALRRRDAQTATWRGGDTDQGTTGVLIWAYAASVAVDVVASIAGIAMVPGVVRWAGIAVLACGLALRAWAMLVLQSSYTRTVRPPPGQELVSRGPYAVIRHPGYAGSLLVWIGYSLGLGSWAATVLVAVILASAYRRRITVEEAVLAAAFGDQWDAYTVHTTRLVPGVW